MEFIQTNLQINAPFQIIGIRVSGLPPNVSHSCYIHSNLLFPVLMSISALEYLEFLAFQHIAFLRSFK